MCKSPNYIFKYKSDATIFLPDNSSRYLKNIKWVQWVPCIDAYCKGRCIFKNKYKWFESLYKQEKLSSVTFRLNNAWDCVPIFSFVLEKFRMVKPTVCFGKDLSAWPHFLAIGTLINKYYQIHEDRVKFVDFIKQIAYLSPEAFYNYNIISELLVKSRYKPLKTINYNQYSYYTNTTPLYTPWYLYERA